MSPGGAGTLGAKCITCLGTILMHLDIVDVERPNASLTEDVTVQCILRLRHEDGELALISLNSCRNSEDCRENVVIVCLRCV